MGGNPGGESVGQDGDRSPSRARGTASGGEGGESMGGVEEVGDGYAGAEAGEGSGVGESEGGRSAASVEWGEDGEGRGEGRGGEKEFKGGGKIGENASRSCQD